MSMPHGLDRPYQRETYDKIMKSTAKWVIIEAGTGSGKTAWAAQAREDRLKTLALVRTKSLQDANYAGSYDFTVLKGKGNYRCADKSFAYADECDHACWEYCPYKLAKQAFCASDKGSLNYTKFLLDWRVVEEFEPDIIFCDEAHQLSDLTLDYAGISLRWNRRLDEYADKIIIPDSVPQEAARAMGRMWLEQLRDSLEENKPEKPRTKVNNEDRKRWKFHLELSLKVANVLDLMDLGEELWFVHADDKRFLCKPLTARYHFQNLFSKARKVVLMSATIGKPNLFAQELGLNDYEFIKVPSVWPAFMRPVENLKAPKLSYRNTEDERIEHAKVIANRINECPDEWIGLIHTNSKVQTRELADRLDLLTGRPIWCPESEGMSTEEALESWTRFYQRNDGALAISWMFHESCDMADVNIVITAKVPFSDFSDVFESARFNFDKQSALARVANVIEQQQGRNRRGFASHYGALAPKLNCLADSNWTRVKNFLSKDFLDSVV